MFHYSIVNLVTRKHFLFYCNPRDIFSALASEKKTQKTLSLHKVAKISWRGIGLGGQ